MRLSGHSPSQEAKWCLVFQRVMSSADFADDGLGHADIDAVDPGQVDAADAVQFMTQVKLRGMAARFPPSLGTRSQRLSRC